MAARHLSQEVPREVLAGLGAVSRVSRALVGTGELPRPGRPRAGGDARGAATSSTAALYLPDADGAAGPAPLRRRATSAEELSFDEEAWRLAVASGAPIVLREAGQLAGGEPVRRRPRDDWVILPLVTGEREHGRRRDRQRRASRSRIDPLSGTVLTPARPAAERRASPPRACAASSPRGDGARAPHARRRGPRRARAVPRGRARASSRSSDAGQPERLTRGGRRRPPARPRAAAGALAATPLGGLREAIEAAASARAGAPTVRVCGHGEAGPGGGDARRPRRLGGARQRRRARQRARRVEIALRRRRTSGSS